MKKGTEADNETAWDIGSMAVMSGGDTFVPDVVPSMVAGHGLWAGPGPTQRRPAAAVKGSYGAVALRATGEASCTCAYLLWFCKLFRVP